MSLPPNRIEPSTSAPRGSSRPIARAVMDLPDPDSPTRPTASPGRIVERDVAQHRAPGALHVQQHGQPVHLEQRTVHRCVRWACSKNRSPSTLTAITTTTMHAQATRAGSG